ncbi:MAG: tyrosine-type recombinase/integrase, partial [Chitinophagaceae bacterium]|nr:tyrosine-type recombinase/integrase [Chitinophagaceae bacterium]
MDKPWRNEQHVSGFYPIHIGGKIGNTACYYNVPVPQKVRKEHWAGKDNSQVKTTHAFAYEINTIVAEKKALINEYIKRNFNFGKSVTVEGIISHLTNKGQTNSFYDFMDKYIKHPPEKLEPNTIKKYSTTLTHLRKFNKELFF